MMLMLSFVAYFRGKLDLAGTLSAAARACGRRCGRSASRQLGFAELRISRSCARPARRGGSQSVQGENVSGKDPRLAKPRVSARAARQMLCHARQAGRIALPFCARRPPSHQSRKAALGIRPSGILHRFGAGEHCACRPHGTPGSAPRGGARCPLRLSQGRALRASSARMAAGGAEATGHSGVAGWSALACRKMLEGEHRGCLERFQFPIERARTLYEIGHRTADSALIKEAAEISRQIWNQGISRLRAAFSCADPLALVDGHGLHHSELRGCRYRSRGGEGGLRAWGCMQAEGVPLQATRSARQRHLRFEDSAEVLRGGRSDFGAGGGSARSKCHQHIVTSPPTLREQLLAGNPNTIEVDDDQKNENLQIPKRRNLRA